MVAFGRLPEFDGRSRNYPIRSLLGPRRAPISRTWTCDRFLDQGDVGACVGFSWSHELVAEPEVVSNVTNESALALYRRAQRLDEWPGEDYEGTSVLAGAKSAVETGWLVEYRWAFSLDDILETLSYHGPVIFGLNWYEGMMNTDVNGVIHPTGGVVGGHAIMGRGLDVVGEWVTLHNSWGTSWGQAGTCRISWGDLWRLMSEDGECCVPVLRTHVGDEPSPPEPKPPQPEPQVEGCLPASKTLGKIRGWIERRRRRHTGLTLHP